MKDDTAASLTTTTATFVLFYSVFVLPHALYNYTQSIELFLAAASSLSLMGLTGVLCATFAVCITWERIHDSI